jgi:hypothetical protein
MRLVVPRRIFLAANIRSGWLGLRSESHNRRLVTNKIVGREKSWIRMSNGKVTIGAAKVGKIESLVCH